MTERRKEIGKRRRKKVQASRARDVTDNARVHLSASPGFSCDCKTSSSEINVVAVCVRLQQASNRSNERSFHHVIVKEMIAECAKYAL